MTIFLHDLRIIEKKTVSLTDRLDEERPIVGRGGTQYTFANIQLRLSWRGLPETVQTARPKRSSSAVKHFEQYQFGKHENLKKYFLYLFVHCLAHILFRTILNLRYYRQTYSTLHSVKSNQYEYASVSIFMSVNCIYKCPLLLLSKYSLM